MSLFSVTEGKSRSLSLCSISSRHCWLVFESRVRVLMTHVSLLHAGATRDCEFCCAQSFFWVCARLSFDLCLVVSGHASTQSDMCARIDRSTCLVEPSCSKISHSCFPHVWHHLLGCLSRLFFVNLGSFVCTFVCTSALSVLLLR